MKIKQQNRNIKTADLSAFRRGRHRVINAPDLSAYNRGDTGSLTLLIYQLTTKVDAGSLKLLIYQLTTEVDTWETCNRAIQWDDLILGQVNQISNYKQNKQNVKLVLGKSE